MLAPKQSQYPFAQGGVPRAFAFQKRAAFLWCHRHGSREERFGAIGYLGHCPLLW